MLEVIIRVKALLVKAKAQSRGEIWDSFRFIFPVSRILVCITLHQNTLFHVTQQVQTHVVHHLSQPLGTLVTGRREIDFNHPWPECLVQDQVKSIHFESARSMFHCILCCFQSSKHHMIDLRPHVCVPSKALSVGNIFSDVCLKLFVRHHEIIVTKLLVALLN